MLFLLTEESHVRLTKNVKILRFYFSNIILIPDQLITDSYSSQLAFSISPTTSLTILSNSWGEGP